MYYITSKIGLRLGSRCQCDGCARHDCGQCKMCLDMPKFGGVGRKKKRCLKRQCLNRSTTINTARKPVHHPPKEANSTLLDTTTLVREFSMCISKSDMASLTGRLTWLNDQVRHTITPVVLLAAIMMT